MFQSPGGDWCHFYVGGTPYHPRVIKVSVPWRGLVSFLRRVDHLCPPCLANSKVSVPWRGLVSFLRFSPGDRISHFQLKEEGFSPLAGIGVISTIILILAFVGSAYFVSVPWRGLVSFLRLTTICFWPVPKCFSPLAGIGVISTCESAVGCNDPVERFSPLAGIGVISTGTRFWEGKIEKRFQSPGGDWCHFYDALFTELHEEPDGFSPLAGIGVISTGGMYGICSHPENRIQTRFSPLAGIGVISTDGSLNGYIPFLRGLVSVPWRGLVSFLRGS
jgi:hypothetical protein